MIKPDDIPIDFAKVAEEAFEEGYWSNNTRIHAAEFLNAAIEAGLVFPRLPATDDPQVLRRMIDLMMKHMDGCDILNVSFDDWKTEAIRTLESEA